MRIGTFGSYKNRAVVLLPTLAVWSELYMYNEFIVSNSYWCPDNCIVFDTIWMDATTQQWILSGLTATHSTHSDSFGVTSDTISRIMSWYIFNTRRVAWSYFCSAGWPTKVVGCISKAAWVRCEGASGSRSRHNACLITVQNIFGRLNRYYYAVNLPEYRARATFWLRYHLLMCNRGFSLTNFRD